MEKIIMRLIDADKLKEYIVQNCGICDNLQIIDAIDKQPTAFDVDKVVSELYNELRLSNEEKQRCHDENMLQFDRAVGYLNGITVAIEIVKDGEMSKC